MIERNQLELSDRTMADFRFDDLTDIYEAMIDWPKRLANEEGLYRRLFESIDAKTVLDAACGTGRHADTFHNWGMRVEASDISPKMIERARSQFGEPPGVRWLVRGFDERLTLSEPFDVAICVGNSLALADDISVAKRAVEQMLSAVRGGGALVVHLLNLWRLPDGPCVWQKHCRAKLPMGEVMIAKGVHRSGSCGYVDLIATPLDAPHQAYTQSVPLIGIEAKDLRDTATGAGATSVELFGGYRSEPYRREESVDLIMVAKR